MTIFPPLSYNPRYPKQTAFNNFFPTDMANKTIDSTLGQGYDKPRNTNHSAHQVMNAEVNRAVETLRKGGVILYPTDTVWGLGCDASNPDAVKKIFNIKKRPDAKSMLVLVGSEAQLERSVKDIPEVAWQLIEVADKPLTIIYDHPVNIAPRLLAADGSLGIRLTRELFSKELCNRFRKPIVSTSANISGRPTPRTFGEIPEEIKEQADYIVDWNRDNDTPAQPSGIIKLSESGIVKVIR